MSRVFLQQKTTCKGKLKDQFESTLNYVLHFCEYMYKVAVVYNIKYLI